MSCPTNGQAQKPTQLANPPHLLPVASSPLFRSWIAMPSPWRLTVFLCFLWAVCLLYGEMLTYRIPLWTCSWPQPGPPSPSGVEHKVKVAVLADPQIMDRTSLALAPKSLALEAAQFYSDLYMRRSFHMSILPFKPDLIIFLGDQFGGGPLLSDEEWQESLSRFKHIFGLNEQGGSSGIPIHYVSGNHDIGYASFYSLYKEVISRYEKEFGARNYRFSIGTLEFVVVDAQTLDGPEQGRETSLSWGFIKNISKDDALHPRVLLTHIPLYRPDDTPCGPYRSYPVINQTISYAGSSHEIKHQKYLSKETSGLLLNLTRPILVLSGHDHDQCTVTHTTPAGPIIEHTLGTISWQQGNLHPSFMLLTAASPSNATDLRDTVSTHLCFLPMQTSIYIWYFFQFVVTLFLLTIWPTNGLESCGWYGCCMSFIRSIGTNLIAAHKEKDEDENCEYEMIWDAEGSMHLVKKAAAKVSDTKPDLGVTGRGSATVRPTAKKHVMQEPETSVSVEIDMDLKYDRTGRMSRSSKSKARKLVQRLIRVFQSLIVIAAVNAPLYMMLLFKDWIDR